MASPISPSTMPDPGFQRIRAHRAAMKVIENSQRRTPSVQTLIPDILVRIFAEVVEGDTVHGSERLVFPPCHDSGTMRSLSIVCRHWRDVAYSHPLLWNRIMFVRGLCPKSVQAVNMHLRMSRNVPLFFTLNMVRFPCPSVPSDPQEFAPGESRMYEHIWSSMVGQQRRWKSVTIRCNRVFESTDRTWLLNNLPTIECLTLNTPTMLKRYNNVPFLSLDLNNSTGLKTLDLQGNIRLCSIAPNILDRLTTLTLNHNVSSQEFPSIPDCLKVLSAAPNVVRLRVYPSCAPLSSVAELPSLPHVVLAKLRMLEIGAHGERSVIAPLLAHLTLPALLDLRIYNTRVYKPLDIEQEQATATNYGISALLHRSRTHLIFFKLSSIVEHEARIIEALQCMPHLRYLNLSGCITLSRHILRALASVDDQRCLQLCPNLESIQFEGCNFQNAETPHEAVDAAAAGMIFERWFRTVGKRTLKHVRARYCQLSHLKGNGMVREMVLYGLKLDCIDDAPAEER